MDPLTIGTLLTMGMGAINQYQAGQSQARYYNQAAGAASAAGQWAAKAREEEARRLEEQARWLEYNAGIGESEAGLLETAGTYNQAVAERRATSVKSLAAKEAEKLRAYGSDLAGEQVVSYYKGGVRLAGSPMEVMARDARRVEEDAADILYAGGIEALNEITQGVLAKMGANLEASRARSAAAMSRLQAEEARKQGAYSRAMIPWDVYQAQLQGWQYQTQGAISKQQAGSTLLTSAGTILSIFK